MNRFSISDEQARTAARQSELSDLRRRIDHLDAELHDAKASLGFVFWYSLCGIVFAVIMALVF